MTNWVNKTVFYHIYPLGFCSAPKLNEDTKVYDRLNKVEEIIPHLKDINVTAINFGPLFESSEHGYDTKDYFHIDRRLGTDALFKDIVEKLHNNGIKVIVDGVFNHVGREFWAFRDVIQNLSNSQYCSWFQNLNFNSSSPMGDPFTYDAWEGYYNLVKLNLKNQDVKNHILSAISFWMDEFKIDGIRFDVAYCLDQDFIKDVRNFTKQKRSDFWLMGEVIHGEYFRWANENMLDSVTNYECYKGIYSSHNDKNYFEIAYSLNRQFGEAGIYKNICTYNFVDNHDVDRIASSVKDKRDLENIYTLLFTMPGTPSIYYGSEWAIEGKKDNGSDYKLRPSMDEINLMDKNYNLAEHLKKLGLAKSELPALQFGDYSQVIVRNEQFIFKRSLDLQTVYIILNLADSSYKFNFDVPTKFAKNYLNNSEVYCAKDGKIELDVGTKSSKILVLSNQSDEGQPNNYVNNNVNVSELEVKKGKYKHFKGNIYRVVAIGKHSETLENMVIYKLEEDGDQMWVRPLSMFLEKVERDGKIVNRFEYIGE